MGFGEEFFVHEQKELRDEKVTVTAAVIVSETLPGKGGFSEQGGCCKSGCPIHLADSQCMEGESKHFLLHLHAASIAQCDTASRLKANRRHVQKAAESRARHTRCSEQSQVHGAGWEAAVINAGDTHMAVTPEGYCQAVRRK